MLLWWCFLRNGYALLLLGCARRALCLPACDLDGNADWVSANAFLVVPLLIEYVASGDDVSSLFGEDGQVALVVGLLEKLKHFLRGVCLSVKYKVLDFGRKLQC